MLGPIYKGLIMKKREDCVSSMKVLLIIKEKLTKIYASSKQFLSANDFMLLRTVKKSG